ncbi:MAG: molecular chaperone HtpG [Chloroflexi bacterium]|jgi:molecular chaperone HtpG|nr:molecular chaperone HtpG [Chloroflexota bacterium]
MTAEAQKETLGFQAEVTQLLDLMIHSLYSNKEIFLRELISNASDAEDKLRFEALSDAALYENDSELKIRVSFDKEARTITIADNGIGMSRQEVIENIGTIAKSGTREFFQALTGDQRKDANLIGQFGVGFYSSFIVADKVTLLTRRAGLGAEHGVRWESTGKGDYTLENVERPQRGTEVTLHLREDEDELLSEYRLRSIITKYSDHITLPIVMPKAAAEGEEATEETVNKASALWTRSKSEITAEEYKEFYKHVSHDWSEPLAWVHARMEGKQEYTMLLYVPTQPPFDMWNRDARHGVKLYVRRIFIMDDAEKLMPTYLRFVRGVIDSNDLPLNVSREILQQNRLVDNIRAGAVKKILGLLDDMATREKDKYATFWKEFGKVLKEGIPEDTANRESIARLLRFASTQNNSETQDVSLDDYIGRMKEGQEKIYYLTADSYAAAKNSPLLEIFRQKGVEVLLLTDLVDNWVVSSLTEYQGKPIQSIAKGDLELDKLDDEETKAAQEKTASEFKELTDRLQSVLSDKVKEVRVTNRLTSSPSCIVGDENDLDESFKRILKATGQNLPSSKPIFEINPQHPIVERLRTVEDQERFKDWSYILFEQAVLTDGGELEDPMAFVSRLNGLLVALSDK